jgi:hypothetical protein
MRYESASETARMGSQHADISPAPAFSPLQRIGNASARGPILAPFSTPVPGDPFWLPSQRQRKGDAGVREPVMAPFSTPAQWRCQRPPRSSAMDTPAPESLFRLPSQHQRQSCSSAIETPALGDTFWLPSQRQRPPHSSALKTLAQWKSQRHKARFGSLSSASTRLTPASEEPSPPAQRRRNVSAGTETTRIGSLTPA